MSNLKIMQIAVGQMENFSYLIWDTKTMKGLIIDPSWDADKLIAASQHEGVELIGLIATHTHFDHVNAVEPLSLQLKIPVYVHKKEAGEIPKGVKKIETDDGFKIELGGIVVKCIHTPGHTPGSQCLLVENNLFTGDTLFIGGCGRVDLPGGSESQLMTSLKKLKVLPDNTVVYPGHDYGPYKKRTLGEEKIDNPYMGV